MSVNYLHDGDPIGDESTSEFIQFLDTVDGEDLDDDDPRMFHLLRMFCRYPRRTTGGCYRDRRGGVSRFGVICELIRDKCDVEEQIAWCLRSLDWHDQQDNRYALVHILRDVFKDKSCQAFFDIYGSSSDLFHKCSHMFFVRRGDYLRHDVEERLLSALCVSPVIRDVTKGLS